MIYYVAEGDPGLNDGSLANPWNSLAGVLWGTHTGANFRSLVKGDTVNIKSSDAAGNDMVIDTAVSLAMCGAGTSVSLTSAITWIVDDGTVWPQAGKITLRIVGTSAISIGVGHATGLTVIRGNNRLILSAYQPTGLLSGYVVIVKKFVVIEDVEIRFLVEDGNNTAGRQNVLGNNISYSMAIFRRCLIQQDIYANTYSNGIIALNQIAYGSGMLFDDCEFRTLASMPQAIFKNNTAYGKSVECINCRWTTRNADAAIVSLTNSGFVSIKLSGCDWPLDQQIIPSMPIGSPNSLLSTCDALLAKDTELGGAYSSVNGFVIANPVGMYPYLNAVSPNNNGWSFKCLPYFCDEWLPFDLCRSHLYYDIASATKTISIHLAIKDTYAQLTSNIWWIEVLYTDTDGIKRTETSRTTVAVNLNTDAASTWSSQNVIGQVQYGVGLYDKYKISLTTAHQIKQYTDVVVVVKTVESGGGSGNYFFVDPFPEVV